MSPWKERRFLAALIAAEHRPVPSARKRFVKYAITWLVLTLALLAIFQFYGPPKGREWAWAVGAFIVGAVVGAFRVFDASLEQWRVVRNFIDFESIKAHLSEVK
ncbi:MAG: hypothetical protein AB7I68_15330 [Porticoccaceae bacterium]